MGCWGQGASGVEDSETATLARLQGLRRPWQERCRRKSGQRGERGWGRGEGGGREEGGRGGRRPGRKIKRKAGVRFEEGSPGGKGKRGS